MKTRGHVMSICIPHVLLVLIMSIHMSEMRWTLIFVTLIYNEQGTLIIFEFHEKVFDFFRRDGIRILHMVIVIWICLYVVHD